MFRALGGKFTWFRGNGNKLIDEWNVIDQRVGLRNISDHSPIWINTGKMDWGPKPFRVNNAWFPHDDFLPFIKEERANIEVEARGDYILYEKLNRLKLRIREWNGETFEWIDLMVNEKIKELNYIDSVLI